MAKKIFETDYKGNILDPEDSRFHCVSLYSGITVARLSPFSPYKFTGNIEKAINDAKYYSEGKHLPKQRMTTNVITVLEIAERIAKQYGIDPNPSTPILITISNAEKYFLSIRDLNFAISHEFGMHFGHIEKNDLSIRQLNEEDFDNIEKRVS